MLGGAEWSRAAVSMRKIKWPLGFGFGNSLAWSSRVRWAAKWLRVNYRQVKGSSCMDHLQRLAVGRHKSRAQRLVTPDHLAQALLQHADVDCGFESAPQ